MYPALFQALAGGHDQVIGFDAFQNLDHGLARRQQGHIVLQQHVAGAVDEGAPAVAEDVQPHDAAKLSSMIFEAASTSLEQK